MISDRRKHFPPLCMHMLMFFSSLPSYTLFFLKILMFKEPVTEQTCQDPFTVAFHTMVGKGQCHGSPNDKEEKYIREQHTSARDMINVFPSLIRIHFVYLGISVN